MRDKTIAAIMAHAEAEYPNECCGVVCQKSRVEKYFPCRNVAADTKNDFRMQADDLNNALNWGDAVAYVHSHPDATTQPSELDKAACDLLEIPWHIVSWPEGDLRTIQPRGELTLVGRQFVLGYTDCWGLIMSYFRQTHGIELPDYRVEYHWWEKGSDNFYQDNWYACGFREFAGTPEPGDMVMMQVSADRWNHAGILLEGNMLLHHKYGMLSCIEPYGGYWLERTAKVVRYKDLC